jgi:ubiquinol-cytochrome c reductase cytochrome b subunit
VKTKLVAFLRERVGGDERSPATIAGGPSWGYTLGWALVFLLLVECVTGVGLAMFYSPSTTNAWASVAYVQDQAELGWLVRGLHFHAASAIVIACGFHLLHATLRVSYARPRELTWWLGILLLALVLAWAVTGYVLRWDQAGYAANKVEVGIAAGTPVVGDTIRAMALGGNDYGNLTLTRFYALHALVLPAIFLLGVLAHVAIARRLGTAGTGTAARRWPAQTIRNAVVMAAAFAALLAFTITQHGTDLAAPADPTSPYDARPLWYFRWLYELRTLSGSWEKVAAMAAPAVVGGYFVALPVVGNGSRRWLWIGGAVGMMALVAGLTVASFAADAGNESYAKGVSEADKLAQRARKLAVDNGVPTTGGLDVFATPPMYRARALFALRCKSCHDAQSADRKGPIIAPGHGDRAWLTGFLRKPSSEAYWGKTKLGKTDDAMQPVQLADPELGELVEMLYADSGAQDTDAAKVARGKVVFQKMSCTDCHSHDDGVAGSSGPGIAGLGSRDYYTSFIGNPKAAIHMNATGEAGARSEMPRFDRELSIVDRDLLAEYLVWLRSATPQQLDALGPI